MKKFHYSIEDLQSHYGPSLIIDANHTILLTANFGGLDDDYQYPVTVAQLAAAIGGSGGLELDPTVPLHVKNIEIGSSIGDVLTWNGTQWVSLPSTGGGGIYNLASPSTVTVGGMPSGTVLTGRTWQDLLEEILVVYLAPAFLTFTIVGQPTIIQVGTPLSGNKTFNWSTSNSGNVSPNTISILDVTNSITLGFLLSNDGTEILNIGTVSNTVPITQTYRATGVNTQTNTFISSNFTITSVYPYFWGKSSTPVVPGQALLNTGISVVQPSTGTITVNFGANDEYLWFATPALSTTKTKWFVTALNNGDIGSVTDLFNAPTTISVDSPVALWAGVPYKFYISNYPTTTLAPMELRNS